VLVISSSLAAAVRRGRAGENWPRFRGPGASGVLEGYPTPVSWSLDTKAGLAWKTPVPGLAHSSPVVWGDSIFLTTAVSAGGSSLFKVGLYGDIEPVPTEPVHRYVVYRIDKRTGKVLWERTAHEAVRLAHLRGEDGGAGRRHAPGRQDGGAARLPDEGPPPRDRPLARRAASGYSASRLGPVGPVGPASWRDLSLFR
jgi:hypothetical protein